MRLRLAFCLIRVPSRLQGKKKKKNPVMQTKPYVMHAKKNYTQDLINAKVITEGKGVLRVERKGKTYYGDLCKDGTIQYSSVVSLYRDRHRM